MTDVVHVDLSRPDGAPYAGGGPVHALALVGDHVLGEVQLNLPARQRVDREVLVRRFAPHIYGTSQLSARPTATDIGPSDVTVAVCTRHRSSLLIDCLASLAAVDPRPGAVLVVDNGPDDPGTRAVVERFGFARHVEAKAGLDRARNTAWRAAGTAVVAYVDDDARAARGFAAAVARGFVSPRVAAVTGLVVPAQLDTPAQQRFEALEGGMGKGYDRRVFGPIEGRMALRPFQFGVGANMAFRRSFLAEAGGFDPGLDVGTPARGAGDLDMLARVIDSGRVVVYEPDALVRHVHRSEQAGLRRQVYDYGIGYSAFLATRASVSRAAARAVRRERLRWHLRRHVRRGLLALAHGNLELTRLVLAELQGSAHGARTVAGRRGEPTRQDGPS